jgi:hypothetical protein
MQHSLSIVTRLGAGRSGFNSRRRAANFCFRHSVYTGSGTHPASHPVGNEGLFPGGGGKLVVALIRLHTLI